MQSILDGLENEINIDQQQLAQIKQNIEEIEIVKGTMLLKKDSIILKSFFVRKGLLRAYTKNEKGKEHILMFASEGWIASDVHAIEFDTPATLYIDALEDSIVEVLDAKGFDLLLKQSPNNIRNLNRLYKRLAVLNKRIISLLSTSALDRYNEFAETYPCLVQRVTQKHIASYLGVTPEALSKIRGNLSRQSNAPNTI